MSIDEKTQQAYNRNASQYTQDWLTQSAPTDIYELVQRYFLLGGKTADIGCGSGRDANWLTENGYDVSGFDSSTELLRLAKKSYPKVNFNQAFLPELPEIHEQFDNVFCETVIMHLPTSQIPLALQNLKRILKPNGVLYLSWRVTTGEDIRHEDGRLYSAFSPEFVSQHFESSSIIFSSDKISLSSQKRIHQMIIRKSAP